MASNFKKIGPGMYYDGNHFIMKANGQWLAIDNKNRYAEATGKTRKEIEAKLNG